MKISIMQPYLFPYIGYFQLINVSDKFILYDDVQYIKRGWVNKNRILINQKESNIILPLKKGEQSLYIKNRFFVDDIDKHKTKLLKKIELAYKKSPNFQECFYLLQEILQYSEKNLSKFITNSIKIYCNYLDIKTSIVNSCDLNYNRELTGQKKIIEINKTLNSTHYINAIGGKELYDKDIFNENNIKLSFIHTKEIIYKQFNNEFIPNLSIIDVMMFNSKETIKGYLSEFELVD